MQSRGSTRGDVPPVDGGVQPDSGAIARQRTAWLLWSAFCISLGMLYLAGWKLAPGAAQPGALPVQPFILIAAINSLFALAIRGMRARQQAPGRKFTLLLIGLALDESVALIGFVLHQTNSMPRHTTWFLAAAGLLHLIQAPLDFGSSIPTNSDPPAGVTVE